MLTGKQKGFLRSKANTIDPILQIGKNEISENLIEQINDALEARELIKVKVLKNCLSDKKDIAEQISKATDSHIVQILGSIITLYKESKEKKQIELP
ncbi:ribosome assembly RNA-binding protein YhbY [Proteinivorax hydrogeniformans]|uniref:Ribosome assembly RNA-binding protein YhbY n=1 Tax=Proteinivorax hydrogeniformans TaxID=1826727 RepID=A0AAU8HWL9_9FIRM